MLAAEWSPGIGIIRSALSNQCIAPGQTLALDVAWGTSAPIHTDYGARLELVSGQDAGVVSESFPLSGGWPSSEWAEHTIAWGHYTIDTPIDAVPGRYDLQLVLVDGATGRPHQAPQGIAKIDVSTACPYQVPANTVSLDARFGNEIRLLGYRLAQAPARLHLQLYWRPERRMKTNFKIFVHVFDPATGVPVAQSDTMPLNWTYPTTYWGLDETVVDLITISLADVPPGEYSLALGIYHPLNGERLSVLTRSGEAPTDNRLVLARETIQVGH
jgi:hypothetical protein